MRRAGLVAAAVALLALAWTGPRSADAALSFTAHMARHMLLVTLVPVLLVLGVAGTRADPTTRAPGLFSPLVASLADLVVVWVWHMPALHHAARLHWAAALGEQGSFLLAGLWLWAAVLGGGPARQVAVAGQSIVALVLTFAHMTMLGALLALAPRALFTHPGAGLSLALADQQAGGALMLAVSAAAYVGAGVWLGRHLLRPAPGREVTS